MTHDITPAAELARESARQNDGKFGAQQNSAPELTLGNIRLIAATGKPVKVIYLYDEVDGYDGFSVPAAREQLSIPATESDDVVLGTIALMDHGQDYPPYVSEEPAYEMPGDDAVLATTEWFNPIGDIEWHSHADAWEPDGESGVYVRAKASLDVDKWGWAGREEALEAVVGDHLAANAEWTQWGDNVEAHGGKVYLPVQDTFGENEFEPRIVADRMNKLLTSVDPSEQIRRVKSEGVIISDASLAAARDIAGRPVAYAALAGRVPSDAEIVAMCRDFKLKTTLRDGYLVGKTMVDGVPEEARFPLTKALNAWYTTRKEGQK